MLLTLDTLKRVPAQTHEANLTESVIRGKHLWERNNCMGCHTLLGEGAYYAPELTKVYERRGQVFIQEMLKNPSSMYPGQRKMVQYQFSQQERDDLVSFFKWIGEIDLNGFPAKPSLVQVALPGSSGAGSNAVATSLTRPQVFNQMCVACHTLQGQGGNVGPVLDGVGSRREKSYIESWLKDPASVKPDAKMPKLPLSESDIFELSAFLSQLKEEQK